MDKLIGLINFNFEYLFFIILVIFLSLTKKNLNEYTKKLFDNLNKDMDLLKNIPEEPDNSQKTDNSLRNSNNLKNYKLNVTYQEEKKRSLTEEDVSGIYESTGDTYNEGIIFKNQQKDLWIFRHKEIVSEQENNITNKIK